MKQEIPDRMSGARGVFVRGVLRLMVLRNKSYQPVVIGGKRLSPGMRGTEQRVAAVRKAAAQVGAETMLDLGCGEGYFVRRCVGDGIFSVGVDARAKRLLDAQWSLTADGLEGFAFYKMRIDPESIGRLPESDLVVCLSLMHHIMYEHGEGYARDLMRGIRRKTKRALVFEMGQSNESRSYWPAHMPDMGDDPHGWIVGFLGSAGFERVEKLVEVESFDRTELRATFVAYPTPDA